MAFEASCQEFIALTSVQNLLNDIWFGKIEFKNGFKNYFKVTISRAYATITACFHAHFYNIKFYFLKVRPQLFKFRILGTVYVRGKKI